MKNLFGYIRNDTYILLKNDLNSDGLEDEAEMSNQEAKAEVKECYAVTRQSKKNIKPEGLYKQPGAYQIGLIIGPSVVLDGRPKGGTS